MFLYLCKAHELPYEMWEINWPCIACRPFFTLLLSNCRDNTVSFFSNLHALMRLHHSVLKPHLVLPYVSFMLRVVAHGCCHVSSSLFLLDHMWSRENSGFAGTELDMCCDYWSRPRSKIKSIRCLISYLCAGFLANQESFKTCKVMCVPCLKWSAIKSLVFFGDFFFYCTHPKTH